MVTILICMIPITAIVVGFIVLKAVQLGLRWQVQVAKKQEPTIEIKNPVSEIIQAKQEQRQHQLEKTIFEEWTQGGGENG